MTLGTVVATEFAKLRRAKVTWLTLVAYSLGPVIGALFLWIAKEPGRAEQLGLLGTKANLAALAPTWASYWTLLVQTTGLGGMLLLSVVTTYVFAREYEEHTIKNMLGLPVPRSWFVLGKLAVVAAWFLCATVFVVVEALALGTSLSLPGMSRELAIAGVLDILVAAAVVLLLAPAVAWCGVVGRGYLLPLGMAILMLVVGNVLGATGWGKWFPWSIVPLFAGVAGPRSETLAGGSLLVLGITALAGFIGTVWHLSRADHTD